MNAHASVVSVSLGASHTFSKQVVDSIRLLEGLGVEGDAHLGKTVKHRSRVAKDPTQPNLRQVHLIQAELFEALRDKGFNVSPADLGENITTQNLDLPGLCAGARLIFARGPIVEVTGLRNPCAQIERFQPGLLAAVLGRDANGKVIRKAGIMGIVVRGGEVLPEDSIRVELPDGPRTGLEVV